MGPSPTNDWTIASHGRCESGKTGAGPDCANPVRGVPEATRLLLGPGADRRPPAGRPHAWHPTGAVRRGQCGAATPHDRVGERGESPAGAGRATPGRVRHSYGAGSRADPGYL